MYIAGAGPVGLAVAHSAQLLGAAVVIVGEPEVDAAVDAVGLISLDDAPRGYEEFDRGAAKKFVTDPHGMTGLAA